MADSSQKTIEELKHIADTIINLGPGENDALVRLEQQLSRLAQEMTAHHPSVSRLLGRASAALHSMKDRAGAAAPSIADAVAGAMAATEYALLSTDKASSEALIVQSCHNLDSALRQEGHDDAVADPGELSCQDSETAGAPAQSAAATAAPPEVFRLPADIEVELVGDFINESRDYLTSAEAALLKMETDPDDDEAVNMVFRAFHTIKGTSAFIGITLIVELAHRAETLLSRVRDKAIRCTGGYADLALRSADMLKELVQLVQNALGGAPLTKPPGYDDLMRVLANPEAAGVSGRSAKEAFPPMRLGDILVANEQATREEVEAAARDQSGQPIGVAMLMSNAANAMNIAKAIRQQEQLAPQEPRSAETMVRVRTDRLDRLIDLVGELVIAQSMVAQDETVAHGGNHELAKKVGHADKIVRELQDLTMSMRMVPLKNTFQKMQRLVRDVSQKCGKVVNLVTEGEDTEIDRNMVDVLNHPLVHMIRNSCDHGIEMPQMRIENGKPGAGLVRLSASHAGGSVVVELRDDGRGLNRDKILQKAIEKGLVDADRKLTENEIFNLIFQPGFSTADNVTDISGRGVGMDVVKRNVESLRGRIDIASEPGKGSTFTLRLPLTLAITDGMLVKVGNECFIVPTINIHLSFRPDPESLFTLAGRGELVKLRDELMPIFRLHRLFEVRGAIEDPTRGLLVVVDDGDRRCALLVDELLGQQQVVAKALGEAIGNVPGISGGAILGTGAVGLILDPAGIVALARQPVNGGQPWPESAAVAESTIAESV
jgi:two-component system chemotaxis sensor kinase CheA